MRLFVVFWVMLPCSACSRMFCFSSSRWPLVVSSGIYGVLPGPLWLWFSAGTGLTVFVSGFVMGFDSVVASRDANAWDIRGVPIGGLM